MVYYQECKRIPRMFALMIYVKYVISTLDCLVRNQAATEFIKYRGLEIQG